ncbi:DUF3168 domain-containing protein [Mesorhizobium sp. M0159]
MTAPAVELQRAIFEAVNGDPHLSAALGDARLFDHAPENVAFPHMTFGRTSVYDWATGGERRRTVADVACLVEIRGQQGNQ